MEEMRARSIKAEDLVFGITIKEIMDDYSNKRSLFPAEERLTATVKAWENGKTVEEFNVELISFDDTGDIRIMMADQQYMVMLGYDKLTMGNNEFKLGAIYGIKGYPHTLICQIKN